jgi:hypothetical protein
MNTSDLQVLTDSAFKRGNMTARSKLFRLLAGTDRPSPEVTAATNAKMLAMAENYGVTNLHSTKQRGTKPTDKETFTAQLEDLVADVKVNEATKAAAREAEPPKTLAQSGKHTNPWHRLNRMDDGSFAAEALVRQKKLIAYNPKVAAAIAKSAGVTLEVGK